MNKIAGILENDRIVTSNFKVRTKRFIFDTIPWDERMVGLVGLRGVGKTTILLQRKKEISSGIYI